MPPKGERRKQQIIEAAKLMFMEKGFQSTHIGQVCEKLDIARGTVYQYFSNKKEILFAILLTVNDKVEDILDKDDLIEFLDSNPDKEAIVNFCNKRISSVMSALVDEPIVIKLIFKDIMGIDEDIVAKVNRSLGRIAKSISKEVEELKNRDIFKSGLDSRITAAMLMGGLMLVVYDYDKRGLDPLEKPVVDALTNNYINASFKD